MSNRRLRTMSHKSVRTRSSLAGANDVFVTRTEGGNPTSRKPNHSTLEPNTLLAGKRAAMLDSMIKGSACSPLESSPKNPSPDSGTIRDWRTPETASASPATASPPSSSFVAGLAIFLHRTQLKVPIASRPIASSPVAPSSHAIGMACFSGAARGRSNHRRTVRNVTYKHRRPAAPCTIHLWSQAHSRFDPVRRGSQHRRGGRPQLPPRLQDKMLRSAAGRRDEPNSVILEEAESEESIRTGPAGCGKAERNSLSFPNLRSKNEHLPIRGIPDALIHKISFLPR